MINRLFLLTFILINLSYASIGKEPSYLVTQADSLKDKIEKHIKEDLIKNITFILPKKGFTLSVKSQFNTNKLKQDYVSTVVKRKKTSLSFLPGLPIGETKRVRLTTFKKIKTHEAFKYIAKLNIKISLVEGYKTDSINQLIKGLLNDNFPIPLFSRTKLTISTIKGLYKKESVKVDQNLLASLVNASKDKDGKMNPFLEQALKIPTKYIVATVIVFFFIMLVLILFRRAENVLKGGINNLVQGMGELSFSFQGSQGDAPAGDTPKNLNLSMDTDNNYSSHLNTLKGFATHEQGLYYSCVQFHMTIQDYRGASILLEGLNGEQKREVFSQFSDEEKGRFKQFLASSTSSLNRGSSENSQKINSLAESIRVVSMGDIPYKDYYIKNTLADSDLETILKIAPDLNKEEYIYILNQIDTLSASYLIHNGAMDIPFDELNKVPKLKQSQIQDILYKLNTSDSDQSVQEKVSLRDRLLPYLLESEESKIDDNTEESQKVKVFSTLNEEEILLVSSRLRVTPLQIAKSFLDLLNHETQKAICAHLPEFFEKRLVYTKSNLSVEALQLKGSLYHEIQMNRSKDNSSNTIEDQEDNENKTKGESNVA